MIADPPSVILALETGMTPLDFYWFHGKPGLAIITIAGVLMAFLTLPLQFRGMKKRLDTAPEKVHLTGGATLLFIAGVAALTIAPQFGVRLGMVDLGVGLIALYLGRRNLREMLVEFDWNSFLFIIGVFIVIFALNASGILGDFVGVVVDRGFDNPSLMLASVTWVAVALSSFVDNVPFTVLMIPVCQQFAARLGMSAWPFLYGMLIGTGTGGNITPVGAAANVFACGILEKHGYRVSLREYVRIGLPFSIAAVATAHVLLQLLWLH